MHNLSYFQMSQNLSLIAETFLIFMKNLKNLLIIQQIIQFKIQQRTMSTTNQVRKMLAAQNHLLRQQNMNLKLTKQDLSEHISTVLKRSKQLGFLKSNLQAQLIKIQKDAIEHNRKQMPYCTILKDEVRMIGNSLNEEQICLKNLEREYQVCLSDYDRTLNIVTNAIENVKLIEIQINENKQSQLSMKAIIFDYEKLKRVLEEERRYFKELNNSEQKSHEDRVKELEQMRVRLKKQESSGTQNLKYCKTRLGLMKMLDFYHSKFYQHSQHFLRGWLRYNYKIKLGIGSLKNCLQLALLKHQQSLRKFFTKWHHNIFPKHILNNLVQRSLENQIQSGIKLKTLNNMIQTVTQNQLSMLHIYEKVKYLVLVNNKHKRKDLHIGWNRWRNNVLRVKQVQLHFTSMFDRVFINNDARWAFKQWRNQTRRVKNIQTGKVLLNEYFQIREVGRIFRKWRLAVSQYQLNKINQYLYQIKMQNKITSKINYQKRKTKALTSLQMRFGKIQLRNYFYKYWRNVRSEHIHKYNKDNITQRQKFSELRKKDKITDKFFEDKDRTVIVKIFKKFMITSKLSPYFKKWLNTSKFMRSRCQVIRPLLLRNQARNKMYVMNQFRKNVQHHEKKQMHQVLTDLNRKMQEINQKSSMFREKLQKCIEELGIVASKKMLITIKYREFCNSRALFTKTQRIKIRRFYRQYLLERVSDVIQKYFCKQSMKRMFKESENQKKQKILQNKYNIMQKRKTKKLVHDCFHSIHRMMKSHKLGFSKLIHAQNVLMFYRIACAWVCIKKKGNAQQQKQLTKEYTQTIKENEKKKQHLLSLIDQQKKLQQNLSNLFKNFVQFENRNMSITQKHQQKKQLTQGLNKYRQGVRLTQVKQKILTNFVDFIQFKNNMIFWKSTTNIKYEKSITLFQDQLSKLNKKKKTFLEKSSKMRGDIERKIKQQSITHQEIFEHVDYFRKKYQRILNYYINKHVYLENNFYKRSIFRAWKNQYKGTKTIANLLNQIFQRNLVQNSCALIIDIYQKQNSRLASLSMCANLFLKRSKLVLKDAMNLWKIGIKNSLCLGFEKNIEEKIEEHQFIKGDCDFKAELISRQGVRVRRQKMKIMCFMAFKNIYSQLLRMKRTIKPIQDKINQRLIKTSIMGWKWIMFYKKTKRSFLAMKKQKYQTQLKQDVFDSLKIYRKEMYNHVFLLDKLVAHTKHLFTQWAMNKIINLGAYQRDQLNYERRRAIHHLLKNKQTKVKLIKRKIMSKWHAWLIPRDSYLPNALKSIQIRILRSAMAAIKAKMYWNDHYSKQIADKVTTQGYNGINTITSGLLKSGFDPDEVKSYLKQKNNRDNVILKKVINHANTWGTKQILVRAFHSWQEYIVIKRKIRKSLRKVLNISGGLGRYWNRWRGMDKNFLNLLQKQSRGNMLQRYRQLGRLMKQYRRDLKDSSEYCQELKQINAEYWNQNELGIQMALSVLSNNLKKGIKQGFNIWNKKVHDLRRKQMDARFQQLSQGVQVLNNHRTQIRYRVAVLREQNKQLKQKCLWGGQCGKILEKLLSEKDNLSIDLADKQHNMKLLLEDNLRLKQKLKTAQIHAQSLLQKVGEDNH